jgi:hypothetical protein
LCCHRKIVLLIQYCTSLIFSVFYSIKKAAPNEWDGLVSVLTISKLQGKRFPSKKIVVPPPIVICCKNHGANVENIFQV